jgi:hypothetical protein
MRKLFYVGLESYPERYTYQLQDWNEREFKRLKVDYVLVPGQRLTNEKNIVTGQVLDAHGRSYWAMSQIMWLVKAMKQGEITKNDVVFFEDMFHPGVESLPYIMDQVSVDYRPKVFMRCLAQTIDPDDFVNFWGLDKWMRHYEKMISKFVDGIICASEEMIANIKIAGWGVPLYVSGLPFGKAEVLERCDPLPYKTKQNRVVFAARTDLEKQPDFYLNLALKYWKINPSVEFAILCGGKLRSNDSSLLERIKSFAENNENFKIYENLDKNEYYAKLNDSKVLFNCALQDWVSNTASEADTLGTACLYPAYRSFPETFFNNCENLYVPWSLDDACKKLHELLNLGFYDSGRVSDHQNSTIERTLSILQGRGENLKRSNNPHYRTFVNP